MIFLKPMNGFWQTQDKNESPPIDQNAFLGFPNSNLSSYHL